MAKLTVLHLSDLHYKGPKSSDQKIVIDALKKDIEKIRLVRTINMMVFSGDIVQAGSGKPKFEEAISDVVNPIAELLNLDNSKVFICPGNHDIDREIVRNNDYIETGLLKTLKTRDSINSFIDKYIGVDVAKEPIPEAFSRIDNFYKSVWAEKAADGDIVNPFSSIRKFDFEGIKIAICTFNSSWRCTGEPGNADRGNLIIGERVVDRAIEQTQDAALRIAVFHHPFDWLTEADRTAVEARLHSDFHAFFYGHVHTVHPSFSRSPMGGAIYSQVGCLYHNRDYFNGYSIVEIDTTESTAKISAREYTDRLREFVPAIGALPNGEVSFEFPFIKGTGGNNLMALLATVRPEIKRLGDEHVRLTNDDSVKIDLEQHFICPPLSRPKRILDDSDKDTAEDQEEALTVQDVLDMEDNILLVGPPESGKTSVIHYAALKAVTDPLITPRLPLRAKFSDFEKARAPIWKAARPYANEISDGRITSRMVSETPILLFVDEVDFSNEDQLEIVLDLIESEKNIKWILVADDNQAQPKSSKNEERLAKLSKIKISELTRSEIRLLSAQWLNKDINTEVANATFNSVMEHISRSGLPKSGYIVSLILWTLRRGLSGDRINEAVLLENIIEYMLNKMDYRDASRADFDFASKVTVLQELAVFYRSASGSVTKNEVVTQVIDYLKRKGLKYDGSSIVNGLIRCGIFMEIDDTVEFRYRRFAEFFTAGYLRDNREAYDQAVASYAWEGYKREMDIYTSRYRNEVSLLSEGRKKISAMSFPTPSLNDQQLQDYLSDGEKVGLNKNRLSKMKKEPMSVRKIDEFRDKADASVDRRNRSISSSKGKSKKYTEALSFISSLEVYTNFIRNIEFADSVVKIEHLNYCFDLWEAQLKLLYSGLHEVFTEIREDMQTDPEVPDEIREDIVIISRDIEIEAKILVPRLVSSEIYSQLGTEKLEHLIEEIAEGSKYSKLKRVLAAFVLLHTNPAKAMKLMSSNKWHATMNDKWIDGMVESKIYQYYLEQHLAGELRLQFENFIVSLEAKVGVTKVHADNIKDSNRKKINKMNLIREMKERNPRR